VLEQPVFHHRVEALAVVVDDPPHVADIVLPALEERLEDVPLVELRVPDERDHAPRRLVAWDEVFQAQIVLGERGEEGDRHPERHRAGREVDVVRVLGA